MAPTTTLPMFLFDGDCAFCSSTARWIQAHVPGTTPLVAWQHADLEPLGVSEEEADASVILVAADGTSTAAAVAFGGLLRSSTSAPWRAAGWALHQVPIRWLAAPLYRAIARNRHRLPGGTPQCSLPAAQRDPSA